MNIKEKLYQKFWFRNFFEGKTFYKSGGKWYDYKYYQEEHKIEEVVGKYSNLIYCNCGNELTHSHSFIVVCKAKTTKDNLWEYKCSHSGEHQYWNPDIAGMAVLKCDSSGVPFISAIM